jgi:hypothetical protein
MEKEGMTQNAGNEKSDLPRIPLKKYSLVGE